MLKNKWLCIGIILFSILLIRGKIYMDNKEEKNIEKEQVEQVQQDLSIYIVQHYTDVKKIEFKQITYNNMTDSWRFTTAINNTNVISFTVSDLNNIINDLTTVFNPEKFNLIEDIDEKRDLSNVDLIFSEVE